MSICSSSQQELILRSGFKYELYEAVADDGYITILTRLINPLADRTQLRQPPLLLEHGGIIDPSAYLVASSIQHFPEKWPRSPEDGPIRSWNRSIGFVLANNGFDLWMAETRGSNDASKKRVRTKAVVSFLEGKNQQKNMTFAENVRMLIESWDYWSFSQDDIIAHELKSHIDTVMKVTGSPKVHLMTYSLSTPTSLAFLGSRPDYAKHIQGYVSMAPIISGEGVSGFVRFGFETFCPLLPNELGTMVLSDLLLTQPVRDLMILAGRPPEVRYSVHKAVISLLMGASAKYETMMDLNFLGHIMRGLSFKELKQMCQHMRANRLQKFDYGPVRNQVLYGQPKPPEYDLSNIGVRDWIIVAAANDALSTPQVVDHLIKIVNPKPIARIEVAGFSHADLFAGWDNDKYVNLPILHYFEQMSFDRLSTNASGGIRYSSPASRARGLDLASIFPPEMMPNNIVQNGLNVTRRAGVTGSIPPLTLDARLIIEEVSKNFRHFMTTFGESVTKLMAAGQMQNQGKDGKSKDGESSNEVGTNGTANGSSNDKSHGRNAPTNGVSLGNVMNAIGAMQDMLQSTSQLGGGLNNFMNASGMMQNLGNFGQMFKMPSLGPQSQQQQQQQQQQQNPPAEQKKS